MKLHPTLIFLTLAFVSPVVSRATSYLLSATFSGTAIDVNGTNQAYQFGGAFSGIFDDALIPAPGGIITIAAQSVSLANPTIGSTVFDTTNTGIDLFFSNGVLENFVFGGSLNLASGTSANTDDFAIYTSALGLYPSTLIYTTTTTPWTFAIDIAPSVKFSISEVKAVPEQGMASLQYLAGVLAMTFYARRRVKIGEASLANKQRG